MALTNGNKLSDLPVAEAALRDLCRPFIREGAAFDPACVIVQPDEIPFPQDQLLVHHAHMTEVLERHHGRPVTVHVHEEHQEGELYTRKISLTPTGSDRVVEWGIVRMDLRYMDRAVREEILSKHTPLGAVLIKHNVLRRVKARWFLRFPPDGPIPHLFAHRPPTPEPLYGRIGTIYCNDEPAIEVIEIVLNVDNGTPRKSNGHKIVGGDGDDGAGR